MRVIVVRLLIYLSISSVIFGGAIDNLEKEKKNLQQTIEKSTKRINDIKIEKATTEDKISSIEGKIARAEKRIKSINEEITRISKKIDHRERTLRFTSQEEGVTRKEYNAKLEAWYKSQRYNKDSEEYEKLKKNFIELLHTDLDRVEQIRSVQRATDLDRIEIEKDKKRQESLRADLRSEERQNKANKVELARLIKSLEKESKAHTNTISTSKSRLKKIDQEIERVIRERAKVVKNVESGTAKTKLGKFRKPVGGSYVTSFGQRIKGDVRSQGVEIRASLGRIVRAANSGKVIYAGKFQGLGRVVMVDYGFNTIGIYGNLIALNKSVGANVSKGDNVGLLGLSEDGKPDLYYELRFNLKPINPTSRF